jgi:alpha/beta superfamily hydrolase
MEIWDASVRKGGLIGSGEPGAVIIVRMNPIELPADPTRFPDQAASFMLDGPAGKLEAISDIALPADARRGVAVVCHPHPLQGGTMHNKVVTMAERALRESGLDTVRFNFRGTGASQGEYDDGHGEGDDLAAVVAWVRQVRPDDALWLAGFSFGSYVSISNAVRLYADALISIAPPVGRWKFEEIALPTCPWLIVQGEADEIVEPQAVFDWVDALEHKPELVRMPDTSHFFHRRLMDLRGAIKHAVLEWLPPRRQS